MKRETVFSPCRKFRYTLWREFVTSGDLLSHADALSNASYVQFIGLNPSTATETEDDPTIRRCINFAKAWGFGAYCMTNLFAFCTAYPKVMMAAGNPVGEQNDAYLQEVGSGAGMIVAAWGAFPCAVDRANRVREMFNGRLHHLGLNANGSPKHPLYLRSDTKPTLWQPSPLVHGV